MTSVRMALLGAVMLGGIAFGNTPALALSSWDFVGPANGEASNDPSLLGHNHPNGVGFTADDGSLLSAYGFSVTRTPASPGLPPLTGIGCFFAQLAGVSCNGVPPTPESISPVQEASVSHHNVLGSGGIGVTGNDPIIDLIGQIDNIGNTIEFLVLELPSDLWLPVSITLSLVSDVAGEDDWAILGANGLSPDDPGSFANDLAGLTEIASGDSSGANFGELEIDLTGNDPFEYLIVAGSPFDFEENDGFRVRSFTGQEIPEPGAMALLGVGLIGLAVVRRRRIRG